MFNYKILLNMPNLILVLLIIFILLFYYTNIEKYDNTSYTTELILYHVDWCKYCKDVKAIWEELKSKLPNITITNYNCTNNDMKTPMNNIIYGYPTIIVVKRLNDNIIKEYNYEGNRDINSIINYINAEIN